MTKDPNIPKWLPVSIESEQALLGAILMQNDAFALVGDFLKKEHFSEPLHVEMFEIIEKLISMGKAVTPISIMTFLPDGLVAENMSVKKYVAHLAAEATTIINARDYAVNIRDLALHRRLIEAGQEMCRHVPREIGAFTSEAIDELDTIVSEGSAEHERPVDLSEAVATAIKASAVAYGKEGKLLGMSWGLTGLDQKTLGMHPGDLIIMAGRPGMGKTALLLTVARNLAKAGHPGVVYSLEMGSESLAQRMISDELFDTSPLPYTYIRAGNYQEDVFRRITDAGERLAAMPVHIEPSGSMTISQISAKARRRKRRYGLKWIAVDYLQLVKSSPRYEGNRVLEIGEITSGLKRLAKELEIPVILLCQLNRQVESREDKRPNMADLRESGNIEQDADLIVMLYREAYYLERQQPKTARPDSEEFASWQIRMNKAANLLDIIVEKQRQGPIGTVKTFCNIANNAVRDLVEDNQP